MKKILNYVANAQGLGIRYLLLFSLILSVFLGLFIRFAGTNYIPYAQAVADQMLPLKIENGKVVEPLNTVRQAHLDIEGREIMLPFVINTKVDKLNTAKLADGVYLTRTTIYTINSNQIRINQLEGNVDLPKADYTEGFTSLLTWTAVISAVFGAAFIFLFLFILSIFYATCAYLLAAAMKKKFSFDLRMRSSVISLLTVYIVLYILGYIGLTSGKLAFFLAVMILEYFLLKNVPSDKADVQKEPSDKEENK
ncbi:MAG: DUF1189 family protein [Proteobacteria bacterium]|nr:DUF1189 family protein [Pseudomonadota bacterium]